MILRLPDGGSWLGSLLSSLGQSAMDTPDGTSIVDVDEAMLTHAIDAMARGEIEYVTLESGEAFLQAAGNGDGPYQIEYRGGERDRMVEVVGGVDRQAMQRALLAYRRGDHAWRLPHRWTPIAG